MSKPDKKTNTEVVHGAKGILLDRDGKLIIYLRDDKPTIPYPNMWDLLGGIVEDNETPTGTLQREVKEEVGISVDLPQYFGEYTSEVGDVFHIFWAQLDVLPEQLTLTEGQGLTSINVEERIDYKFVPILARAIDDWVQDRGTNR